ncbi:hypothetical protein ACFL39_02045 [Gemmatimonadota bacterium]
MRTQTSPNPAPISGIDTVFAFSRILFVLLLAACTVIEPEDPNRPLSTIQVSTPPFVTQEIFAAHPDSGGNTEPSEITFTLSGQATQAMEEGAVVELILYGTHLPWSSFNAQVFIPSDSTWSQLSMRTSAAGDWGSDAEQWWQEAWIDRESGTRIIDAGGVVRIQSPSQLVPEKCWIRVIKLNDALWLKDYPIGLTTSSEGNVVVLDDSGVIHWIDPDQWSETTTETFDVPLRNGRDLIFISVCIIEDHIYGNTFREIYRASVDGGQWELIATFPFDEERIPVYISSDGNDLFVLSHDNNSPLNPPILHRISIANLISTSNFTKAIIDWHYVHRRLEGGLFWNDRMELLSAITIQDGMTGLVMFSRKGECQYFVPLPNGGGRIAFTGDRLFTGWSRPSLEDITWNSSEHPASTVGQSWFSRWEVQY